MCGLLLFGVTPAPAAPGDLDRSFGGSGIVEVTAHLGGTFLDDFAVGPDDGLFVLGAVGEPCDSSGRCKQVVRVTKFGADGDLDPAYSTRAVFAPPTESVLSSFDMAVDAAGGAILAVGAPDQIAVTRRQVDGSSDPSFGNGGQVVVAMEGQPVVEDVAIGADGGIVLSGSVASADSSDLFIVRLRPDGSLDRSLSGTGIRLADFSTRDSAGGLALVGSEIVTGVSAYNCCPRDQRLWITRFSSTGALLETLDAWSGTPRAGPFTAIHAVLAKPAGGIQVVGRAENGTFLSNFLWDRGPDLHAGRYSVGFLRNFSTQGLAHAASDAAGRAVVSGSLRSQNPYGGQTGRLAVVRLRRDGRLDRTFGAGVPQRPRFSSDNGQSLGIAIQSDGKIVVLGSWFPSCLRACPGGRRIALIRYRGGTSRARCHGRRATIVGTRRPETIAGTPHRDVIAALGGSDNVFGRGGRDLICGGSGQDWLRGGPGNDRIFQGVDPGRSVDGRWSAQGPNGSASDDFRK
jgi:uncharacterized delta-60 repeat protein